MDIKTYVREINNSGDFFNRYETDYHRNLVWAEDTKAELKALSRSSDLHARAWALAEETYYNFDCTKEGAMKWVRAVLWAYGHKDWNTRDISRMVEQHRDSYFPSRWRMVPTYLELIE